MQKKRQCFKSTLCFVTNFFLVLLINKSIGQVYALEKEYELNDELLATHLNDFAQAYADFSNALKTLGDSPNSDQIIRLINIYQGRFSRLSNIEARLLTGILELASGADSSRYLDSACEQRHLHALMLRGLYSLRQFNANGSDDYLIRSIEDLSAVSEIYHYYQLISHHIRAGNIPALPNMTHFRAFFNSRSPGLSSEDSQLRNDQLLREDNDRFYRGYYRLPYIRHLYSADNSKELDESLQRFFLIPYLFSAILESDIVRDDFYHDLRVLIRRLIPETILKFHESVNPTERLSHYRIISSAFQLLREAIVEADRRRSGISFDDRMLCALATFTEQQFRYTEAFERYEVRRGQPLLVS